VHFTITPEGTHPVKDAANCTPSAPRSIEESACLVRTSHIRVTVRLVVNILI
jgi:hypothetical protein